MPEVCDTTMASALVSRVTPAAAMWRAATDAVGIGARDALWDYPDLMPMATDIDDPSGLIERLQARARGEEPVQDEMDDALARLLAGEDDAPGDSGDAGGRDAEDGGDAPESDAGQDQGDAPQSDAGPEDPRPV